LSINGASIVDIGTSMIDVLGRQYQNARPAPWRVIVPLL
jgi:hypothetical protein